MTCLVIQMLQHPGLSVLTLRNYPNCYDETLTSCDQCGIPTWRVR